MHKYLALALIFAAISPQLALGDGASDVSRSARKDLNEAVGADAQIDHRLPPVFPGEDIRDGKNVIKSWSTSGSVSTGSAPEPWRDEKQIPNLSNGVGVLVDADRGSDHHHGHSERGDRDRRSR